MFQAVRGSAHLRIQDALTVSPAIRVGSKDTAIDHAQTECATDATNEGTTRRADRVWGEIVTRIDGQAEDVTSRPWTEAE